MYEATYKQVTIPIAHDYQVIRYNIPPPTGSGRYSKIVVTDALIEDLHLAHDGEHIAEPEENSKGKVILLPDTPSVHNGQTWIQFTAIRVPLFNKAVLNIHKLTDDEQDFFMHAYPAPQNKK